jgi:hypothetical protein
MRERHHLKKEKEQSSHFYNSLGLRDKSVKTQKRARK